MTSKNFEALKERLRALKTEQREIQTLYEERASQRLEYQNKMANLNLMLQKRSFDTMLVEDVVVVTLVAENNARERYGLMPPAPTKTAIQVEPGQKTKSLEEACNIYRSQIEVLEEMIEYRKTLTATERDLDLLYRQAVDDILDIVEEYCDDEKLKGDLLSFAAGGSAPCSPRKEKKKSVLSRIISSPKSFFSPKKEVIRDTMLNEILPAPLSAEPPETPKQPFSHFKESAQLNELKAAPFIDLSENDDAGGSTNNEGEMHDPDETTTGLGESSDPTERRKKKKNSKQPAKLSDNDVEVDPGEKKKKKKKKKIEGVTGESTAPEVTHASTLKADAETELIEKKKKQKKPKQDGEVSEVSGADLMTEAVATEIAEKPKEKKKKKKQKEGDTSESRFDTELVVEATDEEVTEAFSPTKEKKKKEKSKLTSAHGDLEADLSANGGDDSIPTEKKKKKTKSKSKGTEDDEPSPLVDADLIGESQESPKKKKKKKLKDAEEAEIELASEKTTKKKKTKDKGNENAATTGHKTDL